MSHSDYKVTIGVRAKTVVGEGVFLPPPPHSTDLTSSFGLIPTQLITTGFRIYSRMIETIFDLIAMEKQKTATERSKH